MHEEEEEEIEGQEVRRLALEEGGVGGRKEVVEAEIEGARGEEEAPLVLLVLHHLLRQQEHQRQRHPSQ